MDKLEKKEPCRHLDLKQYENHTKVFELKGNKRQIVKVIISNYYYCSDCQESFNVTVYNNDINNN